MKSDERKSSGSLAAVALLGLFFLVPLLYVLSFGPVAASYSTSEAPDWIVGLYFPLIWMAQAVPGVDAILNWYVELCDGVV